MDPILHLIGGRLVEAAGGGRLDVFEPATGRAYTTVADGDGEDVGRAVAAAAAAFPAWSSTPAAERSRLAG